MLSTSSRGRFRRRVVSIGTVVLAGVGLSACKIPSFAAYHGNTVQGNATYHLWQGFFVASLIVGGITFGLLLYAIVRFRRRRKTRGLPEQVHSNVKWEVAYTVIPVLIVAVLYVFTVRVENKVDAVSRHPSLRVDITAFRWGWKFYYPSYGITEISKGTQYPTLVLPTKETAAVTLVSLDVVHGFYMPQFDFSRYALPGVTNYFDFTPQHTASFVGRCSQFCGLYHAEMLFYVHVVTPAQFSSWVASQPKGKVGA
ncbi:MAG: cytochrome c oxidase subunit II [Ferrimicrobium sp.]